VAHPIHLSIFSFDMTQVFNKLVRWSLVVACFLGTIELACRIEQWLLYDAPVLGMYTYDTALFTTDEYGITGKPNGAYEKWRLNSLGFRGPEVNIEKRNGTLRIACIGASETFGLYESRDNEWPRQLERKLKVQGIEAEVINAAIAGMSLSQRTLHLQKRLLRLRPDVIVVMLEYGSYAGLTPERMRAQRSTRTTLPDHQGIIERMKAFRAPVKFKEVAIPMLSPLVQAWLAKWEKAVKLEVRKKDVGERFRSFQHMMPFEVEVFRQDLHDLYHVTESTGSQLVLLSPAMWMTEENLSSMYLSWPYIDESWWREARVKMGEEARAFARTERIQYLDLSQAINGHEVGWMLDMLHFSDDGAWQVAQYVSHAIANKEAGDLAH
jgi:hypothetical protein